MKTSWRPFLRRIASVFFVAGATAWSSAACYAITLAVDNALNAPYANGWQAGDDGGFGFKPWNFDNDAVQGIHSVNNSGPFNQVGTAWSLGLATGSDVVRAGRGLDSPLAIGQTLRMVIDAPTELALGDGFSIRLNHGGGNICYGGLGCSAGTAPVTRFSLDVLNGAQPLNWGRWAATSQGFTPLFTTDTDAGMRVDFTLTGLQTFSVTMTPLDNAGLAFTFSGTLDPAPADFDEDSDVDGADFLRWQRNVGVSPGSATHAQGDADENGIVNGADLTIWKRQFGVIDGPVGLPIDWIEFFHFGAASNPGFATDFYIQSLEINGPPFATAGAAIPEPNTLAIASVALVGLAGRAFFARQSGDRRGVA